MPWGGDTKSRLALTCRQFGNGALYFCPSRGNRHRAISTKGEELPFHFSSQLQSVYSAGNQLLGEELRKTAHYRRASQVTGNATTLQRALDLCRDEYPAGAYPVYRFKNGVDAIVANHELRDGLDFLHIVTFEQGAGAAVIETIQRTGVNEEPAPHAKQYIQSQLYLLCRSDDIVFTSHNAPLRDSAASVLLNQLISTFSDEDPAASFILTATLDEARFRDLMNDGIQEIDLDVGAYRSTLEYLGNRGQIADGGLFSVLKSFVTNDVTEEEREAAEKIMARLTLRPGRDWDDLHVKELMAEMATNLVDDELDSGFTIVTKSGLRITRDSVRVSDDFHVDGNRRVVDVVQVRSALSVAYEQFQEIGVLDR